MPGLPKTQTTAHGMLPKPLQGLAQTLFPPEDIMSPAMAAELRLVKGAATPVAEMLGAEYSHPSPERNLKLLEAFRPKDLSQVLPAPISQIPAAPDALGQVGRAFTDYRAAIHGLLKGGK